MRVVMMVVVLARYRHGYKSTPSINAQRIPTLWPLLARDGMASACSG